jgi:hypothetical protein
MPGELIAAYLSTNTSDFVSDACNPVSTALLRVPNESWRATSLPPTPSLAWPPHPRLEACRFLPGARSPHHKATQQQRNKKTPVEVTVHTWTSRPGLFCFHALQPGTTCRSLFVSDFSFFFLLQVFRRNEFFLDEQIPLREWPSMHVRIMYSEIFDHEKMVFVQKPEKAGKGSERREREE